MESIQNFFIKLGQNPCGTEDEMVEYHGGERC